MYRLPLTLLKLGAASLATGAGLSFAGISMERIAAKIGMTPDEVAAMAGRAVDWALPTMALGALVIVPMWALALLVRPPRV